MLRTNSLVTVKTGAIPAIAASLATTAEHLSTSQLTVIASTITNMTLVKTNTGDVSHSIMLALKALVHAHNQRPDVHVQLTQGILNLALALLHKDVSKSAEACNDISQVQQHLFCILMQCATWF